MEDLIKKVLKMNEVRNALKHHKIGINEFKKYGYVNGILEDQTYFVGMLKKNGIYDYKIIVINK